MEEIPPPPTESSLREAAVAHLARFATTCQGLRQVLRRRVQRWAVRAHRAGVLEEETDAQYQALLPVIETVVESMEQLGAVDDAGFARARARTLARSGRSRRAVTAHLLTKGVPVETAGQAVDDSLGSLSVEEGQAVELAAALVLARKRGVGPFQRPDRPEKERVKLMALFARNGFSRNIATSVLAMEKDEAEEHIIAFRSL